MLTARRAKGSSIRCIAPASSLAVMTKEVLSSPEGSSESVGATIKNRVVLAAESSISAASGRKP